MRPTMVTLGLVCALAPVQVLAQEHEHQEKQHSHIHSHRGPGPHFIDAFFTENAFLERKIRPDLFFSTGEQGQRYTGRLEVEWAFSSSMSVILHAPVHHIAPRLGFNETGIGDVSVGPKLALINNRQALIVAVGVDLEIPTGDEDRGLGAGHAAAGPFALAWLPFGQERRWLFQTATHLDIPFEAAGEVEAEVVAALSWTSPLGVTPLVEGITEFSLQRGDPSWWVAPGFRWEFAPAWEVGASVRIPVRGPEADEEDVGIAFGLIRHFPLPR